MSYNKADLINYRLKKAHTSLKEAKSLISQGYVDGAANRLYYSCFYAAIALLVTENITVKTHNGVRTELFKAFKKVGHGTNHYNRPLTPVTPFAEKAKSAPRYGLLIPPLFVK